MTIPTDAALTNIGAGDFTIEAWIKASPSSTLVPQILTKRTNGNDGMAFGLFTDGRLYIRLNNVDYFSNSANLKDGKFHHVAVTRGAGLIKFYIDGTIVAPTGGISYAGSAASAGSGGLIYVGRDNTMGGLNSYTYFKGMIDDLRIWNSARTPLQLSTAMCGVLEPGATPVATYNCNDVSSNVVPDGSGANRHGQFVPGLGNLRYTRYVGGLIDLSPIPFPQPVTIFEDNELYRDSSILFEEFFNSELWQNGLASTECFDPNLYSELVGAAPGTSSSLRRMRMGVIMPAPTHDKVGCSNQKAAIISVHGGGYGNQSGREPFKKLFSEASFWARNGYAVVVIQYRKGWDVAGAHPDSLPDTSITRHYYNCPGSGGLNDPYSFTKVTYQMAQDVKAAHAQLLFRASTLGVDPNKVFYSGGSTGAIAVMHAAYAGDDMPGYGSPTLDSLYGNMKAKILSNAAAYASATDNVMGVVSLAGAIHDAAWIGNNANDKMPCYLVHGTADLAVPYCDGKLVDVPFTQNLVPAANLNYLELDGASLIYNRITSASTPPNSYRAYLITGTGLDHGFSRSPMPLLQVGNSYFAPPIAAVFLTAILMQSTIKAYGASGTTLPSGHILMEPSAGNPNIYVLTGGATPAPCPTNYFTNKVRNLAPQEDMDEVVFALQPNPTLARLEIRVSVKVPKDLPITILNLQGQQVHQAILPKGNSTLELDLTALPAGIYLARVQHADGRIATRKFIKE